MGDDHGQTDQLKQDRDLAAEYGVEFAVAGRLSGHGPGSGPPERFGRTSDPSEAIRLARQLDDHDVTVTADGHGPYWTSSQPALINSELLRRVCRFKNLSPEEVEREELREQLHNEQARLAAETRFVEAVEIISASDDAEQAHERLQDADPPFSAHQAKHLLYNLRLRRLTRTGKAELHEMLARSIAAADALDNPNAARARTEADGPAGGSTAKQLATARERRDILRAYSVMERDDFIEMLRAAPTLSDARSSLMREPFDLTKTQASFVLDAANRRHVMSERMAAAEDLARLEADIRRLESQEP